jgi:DmsE family decaheme c-type cytochrome
MKRLLIMPFTALIVLLWLTGSIGALHAQQNKPTVAAPARPAPPLPPSSVEKPNGIVGSETCALCHAAVSKQFGSDPHSALALLHQGKGVTCESCHGPGQAHVESGGVKSKIFDFKTAPAKVADAKCLSCHLGTHANFERSAHSLAGVGCTSCHSVHAVQTSDHLLKIAEPTLCYTCHTDVKASFAQPFHHKVNEGVLACSNCHNPHGTLQDKLLKSAADQNMTCVKCHSETHGPFVYEHPPVKTEGCTSCHFPHGSPNPRLLLRNNVNSLCLQCHTASSLFTAPGTPSFHNMANQYQSCTTCHTQIHGSNVDPYFFK